MKVTKKAAGTIAIASLMGIMGGIASGVYNRTNYFDTFENQVQVRFENITEEASELEDQILNDCSYDRRNDALPSEEQVDECYRKINSYFALLMERKELKESPEFTSMMGERETFENYWATGIILTFVSYFTFMLSSTSYISKKLEEKRNKEKSPKRNS